MSEVLQNDHPHSCDLKKAMQLVCGYLQKTAWCTKQGIAMDPDAREWGWHHVPECSKEILKIRNASSLFESWNPYICF